MGISYRFSPKVTVFLNHSKSYETPSLSELSADPSGQGGFNDLIDIQQAVNREIGLNFSRNATRLSFVYFDIFTQNDLVPTGSKIFLDAPFIATPVVPVEKVGNSMFRINSTQNGQQI